MIEMRVYTDDDLREALGRISFVNSVLDFKWRFEFARYHFDASADRKSGNDVKYVGWLVWVIFERPCSITGLAGGRDEVIWQGTTLSGVVKTAWLLVDLVVRHELMEGFRFDDSRIFNPHCRCANRRDACELLLELGQVDDAVYRSFS